MISIKRLLELIRIFNTAINDKSASWQPILPLEMAFLDALETINVGQSIPAEKSTPVKTKAKKTGKQPQSQPQKEAPAEAKKTVQVSTESGQQPLTVVQQWKEILEKVRDVNPATQGILNSCQPLGIKDNQLVLSFRSDAIKGKMEKGDHLQICQDVIEKVIGVKMPLICIVGGKDQSELPDGVDPDGLVAAVVRDLGGTYVSDLEGE